MYDQIKNEMLKKVHRKSLREARYLAGEFVRAAQREREAILAGLEFEQWLAESCDDCPKTG